MNTNSYTLTSLLIFFYVASVIAFSFSAEDVEISNLIGVALVVSFVIESLVKRLPVSQSFTWAHALFFWFVLYCASSLIFTPEGYLRVRTLALLFILSVILSSVIGRSGSIRPVIYGVFTGLGVATLAAADQLLSFSAERASSTLGNANIYALALLVGTFFCLYNLLVFENKRFHAVGLIVNLAGILLFGYQIVFLTGSRKGIFVFSIILFLSYLYLLRRQTKIIKLFSLGGGILLVVGLWQAIHLSPHFRRVEAAFLFATGRDTGDGSINARLALSNDALNLWTNKPLFGWGADQFRFISDFGRYSHNNYSELLMTVGIVGFILFYGMYIYIINYGVKFFLSKNISKKKLGFWILVTGMSFLIMDIAAVSYYSKLHWIVLSTILGLISFHKVVAITAEGAISFASFQQNPNRPEAIVESDGG